MTFTFDRTAAIPVFYLIPDDTAALEKLLRYTKAHAQSLLVTNAARSSSACNYIKPLAKLLFPALQALEEHNASHTRRLPRLKRLCSLYNTQLSVSALSRRLINATASHRRACIMKRVFFFILLFTRELPFHFTADRPESITYIYRSFWPSSHHCYVSILSNIITLTFALGKNRGHLSYNPAIYNKAQKRH